MILYSNAKINIGLYVFGKRADGFHDIESVFFPVGPDNSGLESDIIEISGIPGRGEVRMVETGIEYPGRPEDNICAKAYRLLSADHSMPSVEIRLEKHIPVGAGLGGGSSDGVCVLKALNEMFSLNLDSAALAGYAAALGSDCPFFMLNSGPMLSTGRGEILEYIGSIAGMSYEEFRRRYRIEIAFPGIHVSTGHAYAIVPARSKEDCGGTEGGGKYIPVKELVSLPVEQWQGRVVNDFEAPVFAEHPELNSVKEDFVKRGALYTSMTGSGSAIFAVFRKDE